MIGKSQNSIRRAGMALAIIAALLLAMPSLASDKKKKNNEPEKPASLLEKIDTSKIVWPQPPNITRIRYLNYFAGEKLPDFAAKPTKSKSSWMDRLAGSPTDKGDDGLRNHFFMGEPHGLAVDSKGKIYVADGKVGVIFIIDSETRETEMIKNGRDASFAMIVGLAIDDNDRLFVSDAGAHRVLVFNPNHKMEAVIKDGIGIPAGMAIDTENRFLYVADIAADQVLVYDADTFQPLRKVGTGGKGHTLATPGDFAKPTGLAVDQDGNLYVADTLNARIEMFDADGNFIRTFGKRGDGPGYFAMPKGVAIDCDGHVWVSDSLQNRVQVFSQEGQLLIYMGAAQGILPGMFSGLQYITIDKNNRVFTSEVYPGRVQEFRYVTQAEARQEFERREAEKNKTAGVKVAPAGQKAASSSSDKTEVKHEAAQAKDSAATDRQ
ncbi:MAG TPA: SMP-30/gluconolactonase/LRE family protein [Candidatus Sulfotelmatobacter sp.]|nr:SMP-30/gluconolactonase/LRE family protein [Candidatus Sulfotelmatobacter sp.]